MLLISKLKKVSFCYYIYLLFILSIVFISFFLNSCVIDLKMNEGDVCLVDCATTRIILQNKRYFLDLTLINANVSTISGTTNLIEGSGRANIVLPNGTRFHNNDALYSRKSIRNLLSFKDIHSNGYHIETMNEGIHNVFTLPLLFMARNL